MGHLHHNHNDSSEIGEHRLWRAVGANVLLTLAQVIGGVISGSLSLIADALHNFSDAASLFLALIAIRIGRKQPDQHKTFGYKRAETVAALINLTTLIIIGFYLCIEAIKRMYYPTPIEGWTVVFVAGFALIIDIYTAALTYVQSKHSMNIKAAFLHNITDALASVGVIVAGTLILLWGWVWTDAAITLLISVYVLWQGFAYLPKVIHILMEGSPEGLNVENVISAMKSQEGVEDVHHIHIWQLDEQRNALEAHIVINKQSNMDQIKMALKSILHDEFSIGHSTLEFENQSCLETEDIKL